MKSGKLHANKCVSSGSRNSTKTVTASSATKNAERCASAGGAADVKAVVQKAAAAKAAAPKAGADLTDPAANAAAVLIVLVPVRMAQAPMVLPGVLAVRKARPPALRCLRPMSCSRSSMRIGTTR
jgi:hypothetical protein